MKKLRVSALMASFLSALSFMSQTYATIESIGVEHNSSKASGIDLNSKEFILSEEGRSFFEKVVNDRKKSKENNSNKQNENGNPNAGKKRRLTDVEKMSIFAVPTLALTIGMLAKSVHDSTKNVDRDDTENNYIDVISSYEVPTTWLSLKSLICICENLKPTPVNEELKAIYVPKSAAVGALMDNKEKLDYTSISSTKYLSILQRAAVNGNVEKCVYQNTLEEWMKKNGFDKLTDDELKEKWKHIDSTLQTFIRARFTSNDIQSNKRSLYNYVNNLPRESIYTVYSGIKPGYKYRIKNEGIFNLKDENQRPDAQPLSE